MNSFDDQGIILSARAHGEGGAVVHVLSENHGKCGGYVNGAQASSRLRALLQSGNLVRLHWSSRADNQLGRFDLEMEQDIVTAILDDPKALLALQSACGLVDMFLADRENHHSLFHGTCALLEILKTEHWPPVYVTWEMALLKELGYGIDLSKCAVTGVTEGITHISPKSGRAVCADQAAPYKDKLLAIPHFLQGRDLAEDDIAKGLHMTGYFLVHRLLQQSSYHSLPTARLQLEEGFS